MTDDPTDMSQGGVAFSKLMNAIESGTYQPGDRLREVEIADRLSLSRTPIREALRRLEAENIIEHRPRVGAVIRKLGQTEVVELYEMRLVLERTAAEMAAKHAAEAELDAMASLNDEIEAIKDDGPQAAAINQRFHRAIYLAARNRFLLDAARAMNNALLLLGPSQLDLAVPTLLVPPRSDRASCARDAVCSAPGHGTDSTARIFRWSRSES